MTTRIYAVAIKRDIPKGCRLVRAASAAQAMRHVWESCTYAEVAKQNTIVDLMTAGVKVEDASESISTGEPQSPGSPDGDTDGAGGGVPAETNAALPHQLDIERDIPPELDRRVPRQA